MSILTYVESNLGSGGCGYPSLAGVRRNVTGEISWNVDMIEKAFKS
jgi:hypothetical protein